MEFGFVWYTEFSSVEFGWAFIGEVFGEYWFLGSEFLDIFCSSFGYMERKISMCMDVAAVTTFLEEPCQVFGIPVRVGSARSPAVTFPTEYNRIRVPWDFAVWMLNTVLCSVIIIPLFLPTFWAELTLALRTDGYCRRFYASSGSEPILELDLSASSGKPFVAPRSRRKYGFLLKENLKPRGHTKDFVYAEPLPRCRKWRSPSKSWHTIRWAETDFKLFGQNWTFRVGGVRRWWKEGRNIVSSWIRTPFKLTQCFRKSFAKKMSDSVTQITNWFIHTQWRGFIRRIRCIPFTWASHKYLSQFGMSRIFGIVFSFFSRAERNFRSYDVRHLSRRSLLVY